MINVAWQTSWENAHLDLYFTPKSIPDPRLKAIFLEHNIRLLTLSINLSIIYIERDREKETPEKMQKNVLRSIIYNMPKQKPFKCHSRVTWVNYSQILKTTRYSMQ